MTEILGCKLNIYETKANKASATSGTADGGIIQIRIRLRYQLRMKVGDVEILIDDIVTPEFITSFAMPVSFLLPELSVMHVSNMLDGLNVEPKVRDFVSPKIANFTVDVTKRHQGSSLSGFMTVAAISMTKTDYILEKEYARISRTIEQEMIGVASSTTSSPLAEATPKSRRGTRRPVSLADYFTA